MARISEPQLSFKHFSADNSSFYIYLNFVYFCIFFSVAHATVDGVLAFASAELGPTLGSYSGFVLYAFYTITALVLAKPFLRYFDPKYGVLVGLVGFLGYVGSFLLALLIPKYATSLFLTGAALGGIGAGLLWTSEGVYYTQNATIYAISASKEESSVKNNYSSIFAACYLSLETAFKVLVTFVFLVLKKQKKSAADSWKVIAFSVYTGCSLVAVFAFVFLVWPIEKLANSLSNGLEATSSADPICCGVLQVKRGRSVTWREIVTDTGAVGYAMLTIPRLQLLLPYQITFGLSAGFVDFYVNRVIVATYIGDGYIGSLSALATLSAVVFAWPFSWLSNLKPSGKWLVMMIGGVCFLLSGLPLLLLDDAKMGNWTFLVCYFILHGAARGVWESINKAVVAEYFPAESTRDVAFAAIYFTSGLAGAFGFMCYQFMIRWQLAVLNTVVPAIAISCYHASSLMGGGEGGADGGIGLGGGRGDGEGGGVSVPQRATYTPMSTQQDDIMETSTHTDIE